MAFLRGREGGGRKEGRKEGRKKGRKEERRKEGREKEQAIRARLRCETLIRGTASRSWGEEGSEKEEAGK